MKQFYGSLIIIACIIFSSCKSSQNLGTKTVEFKREDIILVQKDNRLLQIPYKNLKVSELMLVLEVEDKGVEVVNAYGHMTAWRGWKYPYDFTFYLPDSSHIINYYISEDTVDLNNIYVIDLDVKVRSKQQTLNLLKDTIFID